jgi:hypothetical protein
MPAELLDPRTAAQRLGITVTCLYDWLGQSRRGKLVIRGQPVTICYFQGGPKGQGRIRIDASEIDRLLEFMRVKTQPLPSRRPPLPIIQYPGIHVILGRLA